MCWNTLMRWLLQESRVLKDIVWQWWALPNCVEIQSWALPNCVEIQRWALPNCVETQWSVGLMFQARYHVLRMSFAKEIWQWWALPNCVHHWQWWESPNCVEIQRWAGFNTKYLYICIYIYINEYQCTCVGIRFGGRIALKYKDEQASTQCVSGSLQCMAHVVCKRYFCDTHWCKRHFCKPSKYVRFQKKIGSFTRVGSLKMFFGNGKWYRKMCFRIVNVHCVHSYSLSFARALRI